MERPELGKFWNSFLNHPELGWFIASVYLLCGAFRLARFNCLAAMAGSGGGKEFLGFPIPQFCPGFNAMRLDFFKKIHPELVEMGRRYQNEMREPFLALDFAALVLAKRAGWKPEGNVVELLPIEDIRIKKADPKKMKKYLETHEKAMSFFGKEFSD